MAKVILKDAKECRNAYRDVLRGFTHVPNGNKYIKHFREEDLGLLESIYNSYKIEGLKLDLMPEGEKLEWLKEEDYWTQEEEDRFQSAKMGVIDSKDHLAKIVIPEQREEFKKIVRENEEILRKETQERNDVVSPTLESYCGKRINEDYVYRAIYRDENLENLYYSEEEFDDLSYREMSALIREYNVAMSDYSEANIKRISVNPFFLNAFMMSDNDPVKFYGKSILELTVYQMNLYTRGKFCKSVLQEAKDDPPEQYYIDEINGITNLVNWFDNTFNVISSKRKEDNMRAKSQASMAARPGKRRR